ncbi:hypothetical protein B0T21DRAFT_394504 [Apiosordaria backusii]|uniref:Uncharacterized protein n=1 Tax=Apiosordaria backusii TaxID=314023 RepID=A0AA40E5P1_9PEZI|nr:hypothetical protein B0T21DRAFT_394504 [Apiosordaria backusii]
METQTQSRSVKWACGAVGACKEGKARCGPSSGTVRLCGAHEVDIAYCAACRDLHSRIVHISTSAKPPMASHGLVPARYFVPQKPRKPHQPHPNPQSLPLKPPPPPPDPATRTTTARPLFLTCLPTSYHAGRFQVGKATSSFDNDVWRKNSIDGWGAMGRDWNLKGMLRTAVLAFDWQLVRIAGRQILRMAGYQ